MYKRDQVGWRLKSPLCLVLIVCCTPIIKNADAFGSVACHDSNRQSLLSMHQHQWALPVASESKKEAAMHQEIIEPRVTSNLIVKDTAIWSQYYAVMSEAMDAPRVKPPKFKDMGASKMVQDYLLSNNVVLTPSALVVSNESNDRSFARACKTQKDAIMKLQGWTTLQYEYITRALYYLGDRCAKYANPLPIVVAWFKLREIGWIPRENCVSTYLFVLGLATSLNDTGHGSANITLATADALAQCEEQVAIFHDLLFDPNEKTVYLRVKTLVSRGDAASAEALVHSLPDMDKKKGLSVKRLRTFLPIFSLYCASSSHVGDALRLFGTMQRTPGVHFDSDTYVMLMVSLARHGCFFPIASPDTKTSNDECLRGPRLFDKIASVCADDLLELTEDAARALEHGLGEIQPVGEKKTVVTVERVSIDEATGVCPLSDVRLRLFALTTAQRRQVFDTLLDMAAAQHQEFSEKMSRKGKVFPTSADSRFASTELRAFADWLVKAERSYSAIVDGPNVAYYGHGFVHFSQIQLVVDQLIELGESPLVVMPAKYMGTSFWISSQCQVQELNEKERAVQQQLIAEGRLFIVPQLCLDDYFWMLASVVDRPELVEHHQRTNTDRIPGLRPLLVTNDQMRDHKLDLLEPRLFRRWTSCHVVNYSLAPYEETEWEHRQVNFIPADRFSREIQRNVASDGSSVWHFPVAKWLENDRLCVRFQQST